LQTANGGTAIVSGTVFVSGTLIASGSGSLVNIKAGAVVSGGAVVVGNGIVDVPSGGTTNVSFLPNGSGGLEITTQRPALMPERRFPPPWSVDETNAACFVVKDGDGKSLAYVYFEDEPGRRSSASCLPCRRRAYCHVGFDGGGLVDKTPLDPLIVSLGRTAWA
jgi:hypothetical protein